MKCPIDNETLVIADRAGVEIDYCPTCRGVWLDRGELDKLIDRADKRPNQVYEQMGRSDRYVEHKDSNHHRKKKESFLGEIFDF